MRHPEQYGLPWLLTLGLALTGSFATVCAAGCGESQRLIEGATSFTAAVTETVQRAAGGQPAEAGPLATQSGEFDEVDESAEPAGSAATATSTASAGSAESAESVQPTDPTDPTDPTEPASRTYFQYIDERGTVRFVASQDELPAQWRDRAGTVELSSAPPARPADRQAEFDRRRARARAVLAQAEPRSRAVVQNDVVLYYATWCPYCRKAKAHLDERGVEYELRNVDQPAIMAELKSKTGSGSIPVVEVGGQLIRGFNPAKMDQLIAAR